ncbi:MAG TPA: hypothetical protein VLE44_02785 [Candidatus Saccharimonadales bacterium]|nr:hypothetical protein [Candidatus Saccharimonadales bacterium]
MNKEFKSVCTPDGWTLPCQSLREKGKTEKDYRDEFDKRCKDQISNAEEVVKIIDRILYPKKESVWDFAVNEDGFWDYGVCIEPVLVPQDFLAAQIDIN